MVAIVGPGARRTGTIGVLLAAIAQLGLVNLRRRRLPILLRHNKPSRVGLTLRYRCRFGEFSGDQCSIRAQQIRLLFQQHAAKSRGPVAGDAVQVVSLPALQSDSRSQRIRAYWGPPLPVAPVAHRGQRNSRRERDWSRMTQRAAASSSVQGAGKRWFVMHRRGLEPSASESSQICRQIQGLQKPAQEVPRSCRPIACAPSSDLG